MFLAGDSTYVAMEVRDIVEHGWYWANPDLGYPFTQQGFLFPDPSLLNSLAIKGIALFSNNAFTVSAVWFFVCFPLAGLAMYWLMRTQRLARVAAVVAGVLFAMAPGHQVMYGHLWLAAYWIVPIGFWLVLTVARGDVVFTRRPGVRSRVLGWMSRRSLATLALLTVLGCGHVYYVGFTLLLLVLVVVMRRRGVMGGILAAAWVAGVALVPLLVGKIAARSIAVTGELPATRTFQQSETYAGKIMDLVMPWYGHRFEPFAYLTFGYSINAHPTVEKPAIGLVALVATVGLGVAALRALLDPSRPRNPDLLRLSAMSAVCIAFFTVGGLGSFVALFVTPQLRTWSRMWLYIFAIAMLALGVWLTGVRKRRGALPAAAVAAVLLVVGVLDQTNPGQAPTYAANRAELADLTTYTTTLQQAARKDCPVFQLPVLAFPEASQRGSMSGYEEQLPYLASRGLRWSNGAMHGTAQGDWQLAVDSTRPADMVRDLSAVGFCAVEVDRSGYDDTLKAPDLRSLLGDPVASTADGRLTAFALSRSTAPAMDDHGKATTRAAVLAPVIVTLGGYGLVLDGGTPTQWIGPKAGIALANLGTREVRDIRLDMELVNARGEDRTLEVLQGSSVLATSRLTGSTPQHLTLPVTAPPGTSGLSVRVSGDPDLDTVPGVAACVQVRDLTATAADPTVRITTNQATESR